MLRGRLVYISLRVVVRSLRVVLVIPLSFLWFGLHGRFPPQRRRLPRPIYVLQRNARTLAYIAGCPEITPAHLQSALDVGGELLPPCGFRGIRFSPRPRVCGIAPSTRQGVGTPRQSIIFALPLRQTERRCRDAIRADPPTVIRNTYPVEQLGRPSRGHSTRNAAMGCTRVARRAGSQLARRQVEMSNADTPPKTAGRAGSSRTESPEAAGSRPAPRRCPGPHRFPRDRLLQEAPAVAHRLPGPPRPCGWRSRGAVSPSCRKRRRRDRRCRAAARGRPRRRSGP